MNNKQKCVHFNKVFNTTFTFLSVEGNTGALMDFIYLTNDM